MAASELNRIQKVLEGGNIKLSSYIEDINGKSGRALLREMLQNGTLSQKRIEELQAERVVSSRLKSSPEELAEALNGVLTDAQRHLIATMLQHIDYIHNEVAKLDKRIEAQMSSSEEDAVRLLKTMPGIAEDSARAIVGVIGADMSRFLSAGCLSAWVGIGPGNNESAGKRKSAKTSHGNQLLKSTLVICANAAAHTKNTFFASRYKRLKPRMKHKKAIVAIAHSMLKAIWHMLSDGLEYCDLGADYYTARDKDAQINKLLRKLGDLGWEPPAAQVC